MLRAIGEELSDPCASWRKGQHVCSSPDFERDWERFCQLFCAPICHVSKVKQVCKRTSQDFHYDISRVLEASSLYLLAHVNIKVHCNKKRGSLANAKTLFYETAIIVGNWQEGKIQDILGGKGAWVRSWLRTPPFCNSWLSPLQLSKSWRGRAWHRALPAISSVFGLSLDAQIATWQSLRSYSSLHTLQKLVGEFSSRLQAIQVGIVGPQNWGNIWSIFHKTNRASKTNVSRQLCSAQVLLILRCRKIVRLDIADLSVCRRPITHLICARLKQDLYDFFRGAFWACFLFFSYIKGPKTPPKKVI